MAYTPINWQTGDTITAEKLNRCDNGWAVESSSETFVNETVTTADSGNGNEAQLSYSSLITSETIIVTVDGIEYECPCTEVSGAYLYGGVTESFEYDFTVYPFALKSTPPPPFLPGGNNQNTFATETAGTYSVKIEGVSVSLEVSDAFSDACNACVDTSTMPMLCVSGTTTYAQMNVASNDGRMLYFKSGGTGTRLITGFTNDVSATAVRFIPDDGSAMTAGFDSNMVFTVYTS